MPQTAFSLYRNLHLFKYLFIDCSIYQWYVHRFSDKWKWSKRNPLICSYLCRCQFIRTIYRIYICNRLYAKLQTTIAFDLNRKVIVHLQKVSLSFFAGKDVSSLSQKINSDSNVVSTFCISLFQNIIVNLFTIVLGLFIVFSYHPVMFLFIFLLIAFYCIGYFFLRAPLYRSSYNLKRKSGFLFFRSCTANSQP